MNKINQELKNVIFNSMFLFFIFEIIVSSIGVMHLFIYNPGLDYEIITIMIEIVLILLLTTQGLITLEKIRGNQKEKDGE